MFLIYIVIVINIQRDILFYFNPRKEIFVTVLPYLNKPV